MSRFDSTESNAKTANRNIIGLEATQHQQFQHQHQHQQQRQRPVKTKSPKIETQTVAGEQSSIQEEVTQLKSVITKTIENNNENAMEVEQELEKIANERKSATERVILTDTSNTNDFVPIVETFSEDDAIVIKPKQTIDEQRRAAGAVAVAETAENDYVIEDNSIKNHGGKLATVDIDNDQRNQQQPIDKKTIMDAATNRPNQPIIFTSNEFDDRLSANANHHDTFNTNNNKAVDDVTISLDTPKVRSSTTYCINAPFWVVFVSFLLFSSSSCVFHSSIASQPYYNIYTHSRAHICTHANQLSQCHFALINFCFSIVCLLEILFRFLGHFLFFFYIQMVFHE